MDSDVVAAPNASDIDATATSEGGGSLVMLTPARRPSMFDTAEKNNAGRPSIFEAAITTVDSTPGPRKSVFEGSGGAAVVTSAASPKECSATKEHKKKPSVWEDLGGARSASSDKKQFKVGYKKKKASVSNQGSIRSFFQGAKGSSSADSHSMQGRRTPPSGQKELTGDAGGGRMTTTAATRLPDLPSSSSSSDEACPFSARAVKPRARNSTDKKFESSTDDAVTKKKNAVRPAKKTKKRSRPKPTLLSQAVKEARRAEEMRQRRVEVAAESAAVTTNGDHPTPLNQASRDRLKQSLEAQGLPPAAVNAKVDQLEPSIEPPLALWDKAKLHQREGIQFMWDNLFESVQQTNSNEGMGAILAHNMGLGKTFQAVTLLITAFCADALPSVRKVLVVVPSNVVRNWQQEIRTWARVAGRGNVVRPRVLEDDKTTKDRIRSLNRWHRDGGIQIVGFAMFRDLALQRRLSSSVQKNDVSRALVDPGADLVVVDEGHLIKNHKSTLFEALQGVATKRRLVLTGSPLQNNLMEYHTMVDFVRRGMLGDRREFRDEYERTIECGQHADSTPHQVKRMKKKIYLLHRLLQGMIHRKSFEVLAKDLPAGKEEFVILVRLSPLQRAIYEEYLKRRAQANCESTRGKGLFHAFQALIQPHVLEMGSGGRLDMVEEDAGTTAIAAEDIGILAAECHPAAQQVDDDSSSVKGNGEVWGGGGPTAISKDGGSQQPMAHHFPPGWWRGCIAGCVNSSENNHVAPMRDAVHGGKLVVLFEILREAIQLQEKVLVFSQSLGMLDLIEEHFVESGGELDGRTERRYDGSVCGWVKGREYYRIDGTSTSIHRQQDVTNFNRSTRAHVFLLSTRAGSLGINLVGATRVVLVDACWNPTWDLQAVFRAYRYGQQKAVVVYRLISAGTMEEKIYDRQVTKQALAARVVEKNQVQRLFDDQDLKQLFELEPEDDDRQGQVDAEGGGVGGREHGTAMFSIPLDRPPNDSLMAKLVLDSKTRGWIKRYHEQDSLLAHIEKEELTASEKEEAWIEHRERIRAQEEARHAAMRMGECWSELERRGVPRTPAAQQALQGLLRAEASRGNRFSADELHRHVVNAIHLEEQKRASEMRRRQEVWNAVYAWGAHTGTHSQYVNMAVEQLLRTEQERDVRYRDDQIAQFIALFVQAYMPRAAPTGLSGR